VEKRTEDFFNGLITGSGPQARHTSPDALPRGPRTVFPMPTAVALPAPPFPRRLAMLMAVVVATPVASLVAAALPAAAAAPAPPRTLILAHYMPWYEAPPASPAWGWHWTMNRFAPDAIRDGRRPIASRFYPAIEPYDSGDPHVIEHHLLLMRLAGVDGVIVDWYGREDFRDHAILHRNTGRLVERAARLGMKVAVCYEDRTLRALVDAGRITATDRVPYVAGDIRWLAEHWFPLECHVRLDGRPLLLSFGREGLDDGEWSRALAGITPAPAYVSQQQRRTAAVGGFDWPLPKEGLAAIDRFATESRGWPQRIPVAFPRFADIYEQAGVHASFGAVPDDDGRTFRTTLGRALEAAPAIVQIATWNDWGEGTMIEPSREFGTRDLEAVQELRRRHVDAAFPFRPADLALAVRLLSLRRADSGDRGPLLDDVARAIAAGDAPRAATLLDACGP